ITAIVTPLALLLAFLPGPAAAPPVFLVRVLLNCLLRLLDLALQLPGASFRVPSPPVWIWILYAVAGGFLILAIHKRWLVICVGSALALFAIQLAIAFKDFSPAPTSVVTLTFLDVGQGDSTLIEFPSGYRMLVDGGGVSAGR